MGLAALEFRALFMEPPTSRHRAGLRRHSRHSARNGCSAGESQGIRQQLLGPVEPRRQSIALAQSVGNRQMRLRSSVARTGNVRGPNRHDAAEVSEGVFAVSVACSTVAERRPAQHSHRRQEHDQGGPVASIAPRPNVYAATQSANSLPRARRPGRRRYFVCRIAPVLTQGEVLEIEQKLRDDSCDRRSWSRMFGLRMDRCVEIGTDRL
jgi:hypothetical protein